VSRQRVALDARRLQDRPLGGVGRAVNGVLDLLAREIDVVLVTDARREPVDSALPQVALRAPRRAPETVWLQWSAARWLRGFDGVFHGTFNQLPFRPPVPAVVSIYDLSFEVHPEGFGYAKRRVFQLHARYAARVARRVVTASQYTKGELVRRYAIEPDRVLVAPIGVEASFTPDRATEAGPLRERLGLTGRYVVAMSGARRRGLEVAKAAWRRAHAAGDTVDLVVVGPEALEPEPGVVHAGSLDDRDWPVLLADAAAFCYPTRYEGFGVPALESIASGTPVVCAPVGSLPEVLGDAAEWCEAPTVDAISAGLRRVLEDPERADLLRRRSLARAAAHPGWEEAGDALLSAYRAAARR